MKAHDGPATDADQGYDLGVLFVHGIGNQKRGEHLVQMGEALVGWLKRWIEAKKAEPTTKASGGRRERATSGPAPVDDDAATLRGGVEVRDARLVGDGTGDPARAEMKLSLREPTGELRSTRWLLAESHWAEEFLPPSFPDLCRWGLYVVPWTLAFHLGGRVRRIWRRALRGPFAGARRVLDLLRIALLLAALPVLSALGMIGILLLLILALLPIPSLRRWLGTVQRSLAGTLGDSLILLESPIQAAAIIGRTARDIRRIAERCDRVAVVAHSQGAAVAHEALATGVLAGRHRKDHLLFTYGSGLAKLEGLRAFRSSKARWAGWTAPGALLLGLASLVLGGWVGRGLVAEPSPWAGGYFALVALGLFWLGVKRAMDATRLDATDAHRLDPARRFGIALRWCDRWATADPVPSGPLFDEGQCPPYLEATEDANFGSLWRDHTTYHRNADGFLAGLARELTRLAGLDLALLDGDEERLHLGRYRRAFRVGALATLRQLLTVALVAVPLALWAAGASIRVGSWLQDRLVTLGASLPSVLSKLVQPIERVGPVALGLAAVALAVLLAYAVVALLWHRLSWLDEQSFFERRSYGLGSRWRLWSLAAGAFVAAVLSAMLAPFRAVPEEESWMAFSGWVHLMPVFLVSLVGLGLARVVDLTAWRRVFREKPAWRAPFYLLESFGDAGFLLRVTERTVWAYAVTVPFALALWQAMPQGSRTSEMILVAAVLALAIVGVTSVGWVARRARPWIERLAAVGNPKAALRALEPDAPCLRGATPAPSEAPSPHDRE